MSEQKVKRASFQFQAPRKNMAAQHKMTNLKYSFSSPSFLSAFWKKISTIRSINGFKTNPFTLRRSPLAKKPFASLSIELNLFRSSEIFFSDICHLAANALSSSLNFKSLLSSQYEIRFPIFGKMRIADIKK